MTIKKDAAVETVEQKKELPIPKKQRTQPYWALLNTVLDPELGIGVVDLGLIYDVEEKDGHITVTMTLTSMGCPVGPSLMRSVQTEMERYLGSEDVTVNLVWEPVWSRQMIDEDVRAMLFD